MPTTYHRVRPRRKAGWWAGLGLAALAGAAALRWRPFRFVVAGESMAPTLRDGEWGLAVAARRVRRGDVVVVEDPRRPGFELVKRVMAGPGEPAPDGAPLHGYWVEGDRPEASTDSRAFGPVEPTSIRGRVVAVWWPRPRLLRAEDRGTKATGSVRRRAAGPVGSV